MSDQVRRATKILEAISRWAIPGAIVFSSVQYSMYTVEGGSRAVIFDRISGVSQTVKSEGTHFLIPWLQKPVFFNVRTMPRNISTVTGTKDMQTISITLRVLHRPETSMLPKIYQSLGTDYDERVLPSIGNEVLKAIVAQFDASELITLRNEVSMRIRDDLCQRAKEFGIVLEDVAITHLTFSNDFTDAVERKVVAQQEAERARFIVEKAEQEKLAGIIRAEGESNAALLISEAYKKYGTAHLELREIEAKREIVEKLATSKNVTYLPSSSSSTSNNGTNILLNMSR